MLRSRFDVTIEEILENSRRRRAYVLAKFFRRRERERSKAKSWRAQKGKKRYMEKAPRSGEGEFHELLREAGMTEVEFARLTKLHLSTVHSWHGHPLARWPMELLKFLIYARNMEDFLRSKGYDTDQFLPKKMERVSTGRYPRKTDDVKIEGAPLSDYSPWKP